MTNQTTRVLELLKRFNDGQTVCIDTLVTEDLWYGKSEKTIRRDLDVIKESFPDSFQLISGQKGCYKAITKSAFENFLNPQNISLMVQVFNIAQQSNLYDGLDIEPNDKKIIEGKIAEQKKIYEFKNKPFENSLSNFELFKKLENAIKQRKTIVVEYDTVNGILKQEVNPHKIIFMNENFYLACEIKDKEYEFSIYRVSKIKTITNTKKSFHKNFDIEDFIKSMQTPFATYSRDYKQHLIGVVLEVDKSKTTHFTMKKHLKSQTILEKKDNGNLLIGFKVTQEREMEELIMKWIPLVKVIEPVSLKNSIEKRIRYYLDNISL
jgi:predicted DNA-binding transcriptional regulator YafY